MVEYDPTKVGAPVDLRTSARTTGFFALLGAGIASAAAAVGLLLIVIAGFTHLGDLPGAQVAQNVGGLLFLLLVAVTLGWFAVSLIITGFAMRAGHAQVEIPRLTLAYGCNAVAVASLLIYAASSTDIPGQTGKLWTIAILTLLAGGAIVAASVLGRRPIKQSHFTAAGLGLGGALLLLVASSMADRTALQSFYGLGLDFTLVIGTVVQPIALMALGTAVILYAALSPSPMRVSATFAVTGAVVLLGITYLVTAIDLLGDDPFSYVSFLTKADGLLGTGVGLVVSSRLALGLAGIVGIVAAVLSSVVTGQSLNAGRFTPGPSSADGTPSGRTSFGAPPASSYVLCPQCRGPNPRGSRFCNACGFAPGNV